MWPNENTYTLTHTRSPGPGVWHPVECVFLRSSLKRWFSLISRSPWPCTISLIFSSRSFSAPLALPLGYHHLLYLFSIPQLALLSLHSLYLALSPLDLCLSLSLAVSVFISLSLHILVFIIPYLSDTGWGEGRGLVDGERRVLAPHIVIAAHTMGETLSLCLRPRQFWLFSCSPDFHFELLHFCLAFVQPACKYILHNTFGSCFVTESHNVFPVL